MLAQDHQMHSGALNSGRSLPFTGIIPSFDDGDLILYADSLAVRVHASVAALRSHRLAEQLTQSVVDLGIGVRAVEVRRDSDLSLLLECLYHANPLSWSWNPDASPPSLSRIAALSGIASYYDMPELQCAINTHLDLLFPPHLTDYAGALRVHLTPSDWDPLIVWDLVTKHNLPQMRYPHVGTLALLTAATAAGEDVETEGAMDQESEHDALRPSPDAVRARDAFRAHMHDTLSSAFKSGATGLEWPVLACQNPTCSCEAAQDAAERRYRSLAFDACSDLAEDIIGSGEIFDALCLSCREVVPRAGERLREQVWAWLCREDGEDLEDPFVVG